MLLFKLCEMFHSFIYCLNISFNYILQIFKNSIINTFVFCLFFVFFKSITLILHWSASWKKETGSYIIMVSVIRFRQSWNWQSQKNWLIYLCPILRFSPVKQLPYYWNSKAVYQDMSFLPLIPCWKTLCFFWVFFFFITQCDWHLMDKLWPTPTPPIIIILLRISFFLNADTQTHSHSASRNEVN